MSGLTVQQALNKLANEGIAIISKTIGEITYVGAGLDDMSNGGEFTGDADIEFEVEIDGTGTPDTFKWSKDGVEQATLVAITGSDQTLSDGVTIKFEATTGHTATNTWTFTARAADPISIQKKPETVISVSLAPGPVSSTSGAIDLRNIESASITVKGDFASGATDGMTVEIFTSPDNVDYDNDAWADTGLEPDFVANTTKQKTSNLDVEPVSYAKVKVTNNDTVKSLANLTVIITKIEK